MPFERIPPALQTLTMQICVNLSHNKSVFEQLKMYNERMPSHTRTNSDHCDIFLIDPLGTCLVGSDGDMLCV